MIHGVLKIKTFDLMISGCLQSNIPKRLCSYHWNYLLPVSPAQLGVKESCWAEVADAGLIAG